LRLIVADSDPDYARMLARAIRESDWRRKVTVVLAGGEGGGMPSSGAEPADALLADAAWCRRMLEAGFTGAVVCLGEEREAAEMELGGRTVPALFKYQNVHDLMAQLMGRLSPVQAGGAKTAAGSCRLVAVYSASGGAGKTTLASGLAEWLAASGRRTFYLNMERIPGLAAGPSDVRLRFARVLYHLRRGERDALMALATRHPERGFDWFPPADHADEWNEYRESDIRELAAALRSAGRWDFIVADCESDLSLPTRTMLQLADERFWLETDDETGLRKSAFARRMLAVADGPAEAGWHVIRVASASGRKVPVVAQALRMIGAEGGSGDE
jgi:hypothetical protein